MPPEKHPSPPSSASHPPPNSRALGNPPQNTASLEGATESGGSPGGLGKAHQLFGEHLPELLDKLNEVLAA